MLTDRIKSRTTIIVLWGNAEQHVVGVLTVNRLHEHTQTKKRPTVGGTSAVYYNCYNC